MKIVYYAHSVLSRGGDKMVLAHLGHLARRGHEVVIRTNVVDTTFAIDPQIMIDKIPVPSKAGTLLSAILVKQDADCVIASIIPTAVLLAMRNRGRVLNFVQDDNETAFEGGGAKLIMRSLYHLAFSVFSLPTVAVSHGLADAFEHRFGARCTVISNGVDTNTFFPAPSAQFVAAKEGGKSILLFSRSDLRKGFDIAREVIVYLQKVTRIPFRVWTVGEEPVTGEFGCSHTHFGNVDESSLRALMSSADVFLYPSRSEGFPLMVLEAFACGCPVVTSEAVTFVSHNINALVSRIGDVTSLARQVQQLLEDDDLRKAIVDRALLFARENVLGDSSLRFEREVLAVAGGSGS